MIKCLPCPAHLPGACALAPLRPESWLSACQPRCLHMRLVTVCRLSAGCLRAVCSCLLFKSAVCGCCPLLSASCQLLSAHQPSVAVCAVRQPSAKNGHLGAGGVPKGTKDNVLSCSLLTACRVYNRLYRGYHDDLAASHERSRNS